MGEVVDLVLSEYGFHDGARTVLVGSVRSIYEFLVKEQSYLLNKRFVRVRFDDLPLVNGEFVFSIGKKIEKLDKDRISFIKYIFKAVKKFGAEEMILLVPKEDVNIVFAVVTGFFTEPESCDTMIMFATAIVDRESYSDLVNSKFFVVPASRGYKLKSYFDKWIYEEG